VKPGARESGVQIAPTYARPISRRLGRVEYLPTWHAMQKYTASRTDDSADEIWLLEHPPVYTQGLDCRMSPLRANGIPVVHTDRGGQITYHGPGQVIAYVLVDLRRRGVGPRWLVERMEEAVLQLLVQFGLRGARKAGAPGVYVEGAKIAALGLRVKNGASYHGLSLNVDMDLAPYADIHPCGYEGMRVIRLADLGVCLSLDQAFDAIETQLVHQLET
jgi:lipoyl(octanoyl) transferase